MRSQQDILIQLHTYLLIADVRIISRCAPVYILLCVYLHVSHVDFVAIVKPVGAVLFHFVDNDVNVSCA